MPEDVLITEGIEDGLSLALACPKRRVLVAVSLANMKNVWLPEQITAVTLCADNDTHPKTIEAFENAVAAHQAAGRRVKIARSPRGKDFNDLLRGAE